jgi:tetratricopeptide (TPR) repeat protein
MSVRWKPLIILSGLFLGVAATGVAVFFLVFGGANPDDILRQAREAAGRSRYAEAEVLFLNALQAGGKRDAIFEEMADFYDKWSLTAEPAKRQEMVARRLNSLVQATRANASALAPRVALLAESMLGDDASEQVSWAEQVAKLEPKNLAANYVLATAALHETPPNVASARNYVQSLEQSEPNSPRTLWILAQIANQTRESAKLREILTNALASSTSDIDNTDRLARLQLMVLELKNNPESATQSTRSDAIAAHVEAILGDPKAPARRVVEVSRLLKGVESDRLSKTLDAAFRKAIAGPIQELAIHQAFADHLASEGERDECLRVIQEALASPLARQSAVADQVMRLHETAIKTALSDTEDPDRFSKAAIHVQGLMAGSRPEYQGLGHLFQGAIDLERSGLAGSTARTSSEQAGKESAAALASARTHLRIAARNLANIPTAQALYGVTLMLSGEAAMGRQYLQAAQRLGGLEPRYQVWTAWSMLRGGYPEEAEPIIARMVEGIRAGELPSDLGGTLRLLQGEVAQARRSPRDLELARTAFEEAAADVEGGPPDGVELRLAELAVAIDGPEKALDRVMVLRATGKSGAAAEHLAVTTLIQLNREADARKILDEARAKYPESSQLAALDAGLWIRDEKPEEAERLLADFMKIHPDDLAVGQLRARLLFDSLKRPEDARELLRTLADRTDNSGPMAQLALLELAADRTNEASQVIAKVRGRWPEASIADLLDAQLSLAVQDLPGASRHLDAALSKDPNNKVAQFWKAQLEAKRGDGAAAAQIYEELAREQPVKEVVGGLSLTTAAQLALGAMAMDNKDLDGAIEQFQSILRNGGDGKLDRTVRWKLLMAREAKGDWKGAREAIADLLDDPEVEADERVQAANLFRRHGELNTAKTQLDYVLKTEPSHAGAIVLTSYLLTESKQFEEAAQVLRGALAAGSQPPAIHLMLAGVERARFEGASGIDAALAAIDTGMVAHPDSTELLRARFALIRERDGSDAALAMAKARAAADSTGKLSRSLVDFYRQEKRYPEARALVEAALKSEPRNARLAMQLISLIGAESAAASLRGDRDSTNALNLEIASRIRSLREQFPNDLGFVQAECELAMRQGDYTRAEAVTRQIDQMSPTSIVGPILRARLRERQGQLDLASEAYQEALSRDPNRDDVRLTLAEIQLKLGRTEEALAAAEKVSSKTPDDHRALLVRASALMVGDASGTQTDSRRAEGLKLLAAAIERDPSFLEAYHKAAEIQIVRGQREEAIALLEKSLTANAADTAGLALIIEYLASPDESGAAAPAKSLDRAAELAHRFAGSDQQGYACLAVGVGYHKAGQLAAALPWMERAVERLDAAVVHLNLGDLLLGMADSESDPTAAKPVLERALAEYDRTLALEPTSIEAVNNKAWILHDAFGRHAEALALAEDLMKHLDRSTLPPEFLDTVGSIHEALGHKRQAEDCYGEGLRKAPDHPILNFHMGRLLATDVTTANRAKGYLKKASATLESIRPEMASKADQLLQRLGP